jgi:hypothetical protein
MGIKKDGTWDGVFETRDASKTIVEPGPDKTNPAGDTHADAEAAGNIPAGEES